jgi:peptide/nickel transport system permease protein
LTWLKRIVVGDWGYSIQFGMPVISVIFERAGNTLVLGCAALGLSVCTAVPLGLYAGIHKGELGEKAVTGLSYTLMSIPAFFMSMILIATFSARLHVFPSSGIVMAGTSATGIALVWDVVHHLIMPAVVLSFVSFATYCRYVQSSVSELLDKDFVRALFARRIPRKKVLGVHLMKNAAKPLLTTLSIGVPQLLSGALITETVFSWPGIGQLSYQAATTRDYSLLLGITLFLAVITLLANFIADLLYVVIDPRIRISR